MKNFCADIEKAIPLKDTTSPGDIVVLASISPKSIVYALVTGIAPDPARKKNWWNLTMQVLTVPPQEVVWTLREPQFTGQEVFTFDGVEHFMKAVRFDTVRSTDPAGGSDDVESNSPKNRLRIVK